MQLNTPHNPQSVLHLDPETLSHLLNPEVTSARIAEFAAFDPLRLAQIADSDELASSLDSLSRIEDARYAHSMKAARAIALQLLLRIAIDNVAENPETARKAADTILSAKLPEPHAEPDKPPKEKRPSKRTEFEATERLRKWAVEQLHADEIIPKPEFSDEEEHAIAHIRESAAQRIVESAGSAEPCDQHEYEPGFHTDAPPESPIPPPA